jgi:GMP synthase (glutamine-hydrolysing)
VLDLFGEAADGFDPRRWAGLIVMGGPMNVDETDKYPFLADEVDWIKKAVETRLPVLGICLGSQLLAKALESHVYPNPIKEIGWYEVEWLPATRDDPLFDGVSTPSTVFQWHGDTFDLPKGAARLARSTHCQNQAFRFGATAYGLQFHLEVTAEMIDSWLCESGNCGELAGLDYIDPLAIRSAIPEKLPAIEALGSRVFDRFAELCLRRGT